MKIGLQETFVFIITGTKQRQDTETSLTFGTQVSGDNNEDEDEESSRQDDHYVEPYFMSNKVKVLFLFLFLNGIKRRSQPAKSLKSKHRRSEFLLNRHSICNAI